MRMAAAIAILALTACASTVKKEDLEALDRKVDKLAINFSSKNEKAVSLYELLLSRHIDLAKKVGKIDATLKAMEITLDRFREDLKTAKARASGKSGNGASTPVAPPPRQRRKLEEIMMDVEKTLNLLRADKLTTEEARDRFKPDGMHAAPRLIEELRAYITNLAYTGKLEIILAALSPDDLRFPLQVALTKSGSRESAALIIGRTGDHELSKILEEHVKTVDEDFRVLLGEALVRCHNAAGIPLLIRCLRSSDSDTRRIALHSLRPLNKGKDFGYRPALASDENAEALKSWEEWETKFGKTRFDK